MNDLISRQAAIDALDEQIRQCDKALSAFDISMKDAYAVKVERASLVAFRETLEYMPSAQPAQQWIQCSEMLPEKGEPVLVTVWNDVTIAWRNIYGGWESAEDMYEKGDVIAWMPLLPKPFKGGDTE